MRSRPSIIGLAVCLLAAASPRGSEAGPALLTRLGDLRPGIDTSLGSSPSPNQSCLVGDRVLFSAIINGFTEAPLFVSDGTVVGTRRVTSPPPSVQGLGGCVVVGGTAYLTGTDLTRAPGEGLSQTTLFRSDGTTGGTAAIVGLPGARPENPNLMAAAGGRVVFNAWGSGTFAGLWSSDGTDAGTVRLSPAGFDSFGQSAGGGNVVYFVATALGGAPQLWMTDGVPGGTLVSIAPDPGSLPLLTTVGDTLYYAGGSELVRTDGTSTVSLGPIYTETVGPLPVIGARFGFLRQAGPAIQFWVHDTTTGSSQLVFQRSAEAAVTGQAGGRWLVQTQEAGVLRLWWSDGTAAGSARLPDFVGLDGVTPAPQSPVAPFLYAQTGRLWRSDGTAAGTRLVPGSDGMGDYALRLVGALLPDGRLLTSGSDTLHGVEPWIVDPISGAATFFLDLNSHPFGSVATSSGATVGTSTVFEVNSGVAEVWRTDLTLQGAGPLAPALPDPPRRLNSVSEPRADGVALFADGTTPSIARLWRTDGTGAGTSLVKTISAAPASRIYQVQQVGSGWLLSAGWLPNVKLWRSDGTPAGTVEAPEIVPNPIPYNVRAFRDSAGGNVLLYGGDAGDGAGFELWRTDGTAAGTTRVADLVPGPASSYPQAFVPDTGEFHALFSAGAVGLPTELWGTDGTAAHTRRLGIFPATVNGQPAGLLGFGRLSSGLVVALLGNAYGLQLWREEFPFGFTLAQSFQTRGTDPQLVTAGPYAYFAAWDPQHGGELRATDGYSAWLVVDAAPGALVGFPSYGRPLLEAAGNRIVFGASDAKGSEPWVSDGTPGGTRRLLDVNPGYLGSEPRLIARAADHWLLSADDGATGVEPWVLRLSALDEPAPLRGDVDSDRDVDPADGAAYAALYGAQVGDETFPPAADLDGDGAITSADHQLWVEEFGAAPIPIFPLLTRSSPAAP